MPRYEYLCHRCGKNFEVSQKFADQPLTVHEECGGDVERLISVPALQFKGTGWYVTDYGRGNNGPSGSNGGNGKSESKSESSKSDSSSSKSETSKSDSSKSETKSDSSTSKSENKTK